MRCRMKNGPKMGKKWVGKRFAGPNLGSKVASLQNWQLTPVDPSSSPLTSGGQEFKFKKKLHHLSCGVVQPTSFFRQPPGRLPPPPGSHPSMSTPLQYASEWDCGKGACALNGFHRMLFSLRPCPTPPTPSFRPYALDSGGARQPNPEPLCVDAGPDCCCRRWSGNGLPPPEPCLAPPNAACHVRGRLANICKHLSLQDIPDDTLFSSFSPDYNNPSITFDGSKLIFRF